MLANIRISVEECLRKITLVPYGCGSTLHTGYVLLDSLPYPFATYSDKFLSNCVLFCRLPRKPLTSSRKTKLHCTFFMPYATISLHAMFDFFIAMSGLFVTYFWCLVFSVYFKNSFTFFLQSSFTHLISTIF